MRTEQILQKMTFTEMIKNLGINQNNDEHDFRRWFSKIGGNCNFSDEEISIGYANHKRGINRIVIKYELL